MNSKRAIEILEAAKNQIRREKEIYVCYAVERAGGETPECKYLLKWIRKSLGNALTVRLWLREKKIELDRMNMRLYRMQWIDSMIEALQR